jgi:hypothetical protein
MAKIAAAGLVAAVVSVAAAFSTAGASDSPTSPLRIVQAKTPQFRVPGYGTHGTYPQVSRRQTDLRAVNAALQAAVLLDQREYARRARPDRADFNHFHKAVGPWRGFYATRIDRKLVSASTVVVSVLLPTRRELFVAHSGGDGWLGVTIGVPSGRQIGLRELFARPKDGLRAFGQAWAATLRRQGAGWCLDSYWYWHDQSQWNRQFALTASGIALGVDENSACGAVAAIVPYVVVRPYLSKLGAELVAGVRRPL